VVRLNSGSVNKGIETPVSGLALRRAPTHQFTKSKGMIDVLDLTDGKKAPQGKLGLKKAVSAINPKSSSAFASGSKRPEKENIASPFSIISPRARKMTGTIGDALSAKVQLMFSKETSGGPTEEEKTDETKSDLKSDINSDLKAALELSPSNHEELRTPKEKDFDGPGEPLATSDTFEKSASALETPTQSEETQDSTK